MKQASKKTNKRTNTNTTVTLDDNSQPVVTEEPQATPVAPTATDSPFKIGDFISVPEGGMRGTYQVENILPNRKGDEYHIEGRFFNKAGQARKTYHLNQTHNATIGEAPEVKAPKSIKAENVTVDDLPEIKEAIS